MDKMIRFLQEHYQNPTKKFCFFTGQNDPEIAQILGIEQWDWTPQPTVNIEPWFWNTHTFALAFGCEKVFTSEGKEWIKDLITDPAQVKDIEIPEVHQGRTGEILEQIEKLKNNSDENTLIRLPDIQSPLGVAELLWDQSFYLALITNPDEIHDLLSKVSIFIVNYIKEIRKILGDRLNAQCHPQIWCDSLGYYISDDVNSMVSPEMHDEFSVQYINRLTEQLGPVYYHSCTWTPPYYENIHKIKNKRIANWSIGTSADMADLIVEFSGETVLSAHLGHDVHHERALQNYSRTIMNFYDLVLYVLDHMRDNSTLYLDFQHSLIEDKNLLKKIYHLLDERGYSPQAALGLSST